jgi:hypothetical protein
MNKVRLRRAAIALLCPMATTGCGEFLLDHQCLSKTVREFGASDARPSRESSGERFIVSARLKEL